MKDSSIHPITLALRNSAPEDPEAAASLLPILYDELRRFAHSLMAEAKPGNTLQATALVHEAFIRLVPAEDPGWNSRAHFFGAAVQAMRRILVDQARHNQAIKSGGEMQRVDIEIEALGIDGKTVDFLALDQALEELEALDMRKVNVVLLRHLTGLSIAETAVALDVSTSTVENDWRFARAFLFEQLSPDNSVREKIP